MESFCHLSRVFFGGLLFKLHQFYNLMKNEKEIYIFLKLKFIQIHFNPMSSHPIIVLHFLSMFKLLPSSLLQVSLVDHDSSQDDGVPEKDSLVLTPFFLLLFSPFNF